jgi:hypothetical protein
VDGGAPTFTFEEPSSASGYDVNHAPVDTVCDTSLCTLAEPDLHG